VWKRLDQTVFSTQPSLLSAQRSLSHAEKRFLSNILMKSADAPGRVQIVSMPHAVSLR
jgi:hypothetical protein